MADVVPSFDFTFSWKRKTDAPRTLIKGASVSYGDVSYFNPYDSNEVFAYDCVKDEWQQLPPLPDDQRYFQLAIINGTLTTIGGEVDGGLTGFVKSRTFTGRLLVYNGEEWSKNLVPPMRTQRAFPSAVVVDKYLIVAGGQIKTRALPTVEVLDLENMEWHKAEELPEDFSEMSATVCGGRIYLGGGLCREDSACSVYSCSIATLLRCCGLQQNQEIEPTTNEHDVWIKEPNALPWTRSTLITLGDQLLAVGGQDSRRKPVDEVVTYHQGKWHPIGKLRAANRHDFLLTVIENRLIMVGGFSTDLKRCATVEVANVELSGK